MKNKIVIATRGSQLALIQSNMIKDWILNKRSDLSVELKIIKTTGDKILDAPLSKVGGKGLFVKEIEESLLSNESDIAVHSMKDVPTTLPEGLHITAIGERENPYDAFISHKYKSFDSLPDGAKIGTSSLRRQVQLLNANPTLKMKDIRGNVNTRLSKLESEDLDAIILACAGVIRMGLDNRITEVIPANISIPAVGQGAIGVESRIEDDFINNLMSDFDHKLTHQRLLAERAFMRTLEGGCQVPIGGHAVIDEDSNSMTLMGMVASLDGKKMLKDEVQEDLTDSEQLGISLAEKLIGQGAKDILKEIRQL